MVSGNLRIKNNYYYIVLSFKGIDNIRKQKWFATGINAKTGSKREANMLLTEYQKNFDVESEEIISEIISKSSVVKTNQKNNIIKPQPINEQSKILFCDYLLEWVERMRNQLAENTFYDYKRTLKNVLYPYFKKKKIRLCDLTVNDIEEFYTYKQKTCKPITILHFHAYIRKSLKMAYLRDLIPSNPADKVTRPKAEQYIANYYNTEEMARLFDCIKGHKAELPIMIAAYYGLRRSEIMGLKWDSVDWFYNTITVKHTVTTEYIKGENLKYFCKDRGKTKKSYRSLPIFPIIGELLKKEKQKQLDNQKYYKKSYCKDFLDYICVDDMGKLLPPNSISKMYKTILQKNELKIIRFHDLRHSCATLLRHEGVPLEDIQRWMGHSDIKTTENIYAHFDNERHLKSAQKIISAFDNFEKKIENDDEMER